MDYSLPDSTVHGILQATILESYASPCSRGSWKPRDGTQVSCIEGGFFTVWATWEVTSVNCFQRLIMNFILEMWPSLGRWWGSHPKQEACFGKHSMCKWVFWNILLFLCMECSGVKMCNEKGKYLMYGAYNICGTFLQFWLCEVFFTFQLLPLLCLLGFLGIHNEGSVIYLQIYRAWIMVKLSLPLRRRQ